MAIVEVKVPQLSESVAEATMLTWKKKAGEAVAVDEILIEIETDKVVNQIEATQDGVLKKQGGVLHSTKHDGQGIGLVSVETAVHRYHGNLTVETGGNVFRANVLLNL
jgi:pyruvate/2-oxoglutarate dehydrogenase complex dihydrolipoamide acyltransferase (E2) component